MLISGVVISKNEGKNIARCISSLLWCDEIIVIDDNSTDNTVNVAKEYKVKLYQHNLNNNFAQQRNFGLENAAGKWVLFVDADEVVAERLQKEILSHIYAKNKINAYSIKRKDTMWGRELRYGDSGNIRLVRLGRKGCGKWEGMVHEKWNIEGRVGMLMEPLHHYPHQTVAEFISKINYYSTIRAQELFEQKVSVGPMQIIFYPKAKFLYNFFFKCGFMDGMEGFIFAIIMSFHSFLVRAKLWLLWQERKSIKN